MRKSDLSYKVRKTKCSASCLVCLIFENNVYTLGPVFPTQTIFVRRQWDHLIEVTYQFLELCCAVTVRLIVMIDEVRDIHKFFPHVMRITPFCIFFFLTFLTEAVFNLLFPLSPPFVLVLFSPRTENWHFNM